MVLMVLTDQTTPVVVRGRVLVDTFPMFFDYPGAIHEKSIMSSLVVIDDELLFQSSETILQSVVQDILDIIAPVPSVFVDRILVDTITSNEEVAFYRLGDSVQPEFQFLRRATSQAQVSDVLFRYLEFTRRILSLPEISSSVVIPELERGFYRLVQSGIDIPTDTEYVFRELLRVGHSQFDVADQLLVYRLLARRLTDTAALQDAVIREVGKGPVILHDNFDVNDALLQVARERAHSLLESIDANDALQVFVLGVREILLQDSLGVGDLSQQERIRLKFLLDTIGVQDTTYAQQREALRKLISTVATSDTIAKQYQLFRRTLENVDIADELLRTLTRYVASTVIIMMGIELAKIEMQISLAPIVMEIRT